MTTVTYKSFIFKYKHFCWHKESKSNWDYQQNRKEEEND
jgi:hypothetical protein